MPSRSRWPPSRAAKTSSQRRPNLIFVFADQLRYSSCGYAGDEYAHTSNMDRLAAEGSNLHQAITSTPVCAPYRASLMTGKYQSSTGMVINEIRLSPNHDCFGHALTRAQYQTAYIGKWHLWANQLGHHELIRNGFTPPGPYRLGFDGFWEAYNFNHFYFHSPYFNNSADPHIRPQYEPDEQTGRAIEYIRGAAAKSDPFALFLSWGPPHSPWGPGNVHPEWAARFRDTRIPRPPNFSTTPDPYADAWQTLPKNFEAEVDDEVRAYYAQTANLDWNLGRLMKALDDQGIADNTILVFTSDHGEMFGSHGRHGKLIFYEEAARIPFLIRWPAKIKPHTVSDVLLGTPDIMPTLLSMLNIPVPTGVEGADLSKPLISGSGAAPEIANLQGMGATAAWADGSEWRATRDHEFTYATYGGMAGNFSSTIARIPTRCAISRPTAASAPR
jgi:arylsulfatase A-like enzyme